MKAFEEAVEKAGGQSAFARAVGCTQGAIWQMLRKRRPLSARFVLSAEQATGISRHDLRPDLYPREPAPLPRAESYPDGMEPAR